MNHIYSSVWNEALGVWIAVSEIAKRQGQGKRSANRRKLLATSLLICSTPTWALPTGDQLVGGQATISTPNAEQMQINQASQKAVINWQGFSVAPNEAVNIQQPNAHAALLNRVVGQDSSQIQGQINANGQVYLVNPNGVVFGKTAQVDVGGLIATTHNIKDADFMNGNQHFTQDGDIGKVENHGTINAKESGVVALIGEQVTNTGTINTPKGTTALAAGKTVDLDFQGNGLVEVKVTEAALNAQITNQGAIQADGGRVVMSAKAANQLIDTVINQEGIVKARGLVERNGEIILDGGDNGITKVSGTLNANGNGAGEKGGKIVVTGDKVLVDSTAKLTATGATGGGDILVGSSWQNSDPSIRQANATVVKQDAVLDVSATDTGKGGTVVAWSNVQNTQSATRAQGTFLAKGGVNGGDGGRIETSGHWLNTDNIKVNTSATQGNSGLWLLDPWNVTIGGSVASGDPFANPFIPTTQDSTILATDIAAALNLGNNVRITTGTTGSSAGDITINSSIAKTLGGDATLTLQAANSIYDNSQTISSTAGRLNIVFQSDSDTTGGGSIQSSFATFNSNGGNITFSGGIGGTGYARANNIFESGIGLSYNTITSNGGNIIMRGMSFNGTNVSGGGGRSDGVFISGNTSIDSGSGTISIDGLAQGQDPILISNGIEIGDFSTVDIRSANGTTNAISLTGTANYTGLTALSPQAQRYGILMQNVFSEGQAETTLAATNGGGITLIGSSNADAGIHIDPNVNILANSGKITLDGSTTGTTHSAVESTGIIGQQAGSLVPVSSSNIDIIANSLNLTTSSLAGTPVVSDRISSTGILTIRPKATNRAMTVQVGSGNNSQLYVNLSLFGTNLPISSTFSKLVFGSSTTGIMNVSGLNFDNTYNPNLQGVDLLTGSSLTLGGTTNTVRGINRVLSIAATGGGAVTSTSALDVNNLVLKGTNSVFTLHNSANTIDTVAGILGSGSLNLRNSKTLRIGSINGINGIDPTGTGSVTIEALGATSDIILDQPVVAQDGNIVLAAGRDFINNVSPVNSGIVLNGIGRYFVYSSNPANSLEGMSGYNKHYNQTYTSGVIPSYASAGNWFFYTITPQLFVAPDPKTIIYGDPLGTYTANYVGFIDADTATTAGISGTALFDTLGPLSPEGYFTLGLHNASYISGLLSSLGYSFADNIRSVDELTVIPPSPVHEVVPPPVFEVFIPDQAVQENIAGLITSVNTKPIITFDPPTVSPDVSVNDVTDVFVNSDQPCNESDDQLRNPLLHCQKRKEKKGEYNILPVLKIKNSSGRVKHLEMSANKKFVSLLFEDGSVRVWDFQSGIQRQVVTPNKKPALIDIGTVNDQGESLQIASKTSIDVHDIISAIADEKLAINEPDISHFATSNDGSLLLVDFGANELSLWDNKQNKKLWQLPYQRGSVRNLALANNKRYGAVLSYQLGAYVMPSDLQLKSITDAVDIIDLDTGKIIKSLPNLGEQVVAMHFKNNDTLQVGLESGELFDWHYLSNSQKIVANFAESLVAVDNDKDTYVYLLKDGTLRVGDAQGHIRLSIKNKENKVEDARLIEDGKKLLTVLDNGELALWDATSGKKMLRLFSTKQGWTVMDAFGRFDSSEDAMDNFSWLANEEEIPLNSFSENYYEPGLLSNVLQNQDYLNNDPDRVLDGISLPPKITAMLAEQQAKGDSVAVQLDVYDRGGGIDRIKVYQNGKLINPDNLVTLPESNAEHRAITLDVIPSAGKNTVKVVVSNDMGIENSSSELSFDGKTKAYTSSLRLLTVGINEYSDVNLNLDYSVADADSIVQAIKIGSKIMVNTHLINENATKAKILAELRKLSQGTQQDVLVVYLAGHGMALGKEWYFLPYETTLQSTPEKIAATGITATELSDIFKNSKIQHIMLMVDSCYSGAGMGAFSKLQNGQRYFTRQLSRTLGITVVTATTKDEEAAELKSLGHGLFTYLITQELGKEEAAGNATAHGVAESIVKTLPVFSKKMLGSSQDPAVYKHGNDFMLTDIVNDKK
jgi:filamentous hemagglutinin family protein